MRRNGRIALVFVLAIALFAIAAVSVNGFSSPKSMENILLAATILALVAGGQTLVIFGGGIDLSVPWMMTAAAVCTAALAKGDDGALVWVIPTVIGIATGVGLFNAVGVTVLLVSPIVMTLATNVMLSGLLSLYVGTDAASEAPEFVAGLAFGRVLGLPTPLFILLGATAAMTVLLTFTPFGRRLYAVGTSVTASRFSGVRPATVIGSTYALSSVMAALAGILLLGFVGRAYAGMGDQYQFASIAAVIVGGASILGGSGHYIGTIAGVFLLTVLNALLQVFNLGPGSISLFYGSVILLSVWLAQLDLRTAFGKRRRRGAAAHPEEPVADAV